MTSLAPEGVPARGAISEHDGVRGHRRVNRRDRMMFCLRDPGSNRTPSLHGKGHSQRSVLVTESATAKVAPLLFHVLRPNLPSEKSAVDLHLPPEESSRHEVGDFMPELVQP